VDAITVTQTFRADVITDRSGLADIGPEWHDLFLRSGCRHPFLSFEWLSTWFDELGTDRSLFVIAVRAADGRLVGLAPLSTERLNLPGLNVRRLCFLGDRLVGSDYLSVLVDRDAVEPTVDQIVAALEARTDDWDYVDLIDTDPDAPILDPLFAKLEQTFTFGEVRQGSVCPYAPLPATFDEYFANLGANLRSKLRRLGRRLAERGAVEWLEHTEPLDVLRPYDDLVALHALRFEDRGDESAFLDPRAQRFHRTVLTRMATRGWVRLFEVRVEGKTIASLLGYHTTGKFAFYQAGMDPEWSELRPGQLLMSRTIERAIERGCDEYDFLRGAEDYKKMWADKVRHTRNFTCYGRGWRATGARLAHATRRQIVSTVKGQPSSSGDAE
jgi:CelD/BcsL family acetyltransferase involved in cellulose biosynthesis